MTHTEAIAAVNTTLQSYLNDTYGSDTCLFGAVEPARKGEQTQLVVYNNYGDAVQVASLDTTYKCVAWHYVTGGAVVAGSGRGKRDFGRVTSDVSLYVWACRVNGADSERFAQWIASRVSGEHRYAATPLIAVAQIQEWTTDPVEVLGDAFPGADPELLKSDYYFVKIDYELTYSATECDTLT